MTEEIPILDPNGYTICPDEVRDGPPWGSQTFAGSDGSHQPSKLELEVAENHGSSFTKIVSRLNRA
ncbi:hypothetical protein K443DRAFT_8371 [Laccaria amethystina LaAM-08-1]|uniref:Uncharacterized protein n=1 Tax=Laccaria amethystina LaAM-08-1 TaxID=1095629 RepID=A0A0C9XDA1_9AGAR|nr:hypothetical protein K443DRAFT_8371 [Laccaria amethystina LaAM-08-1]